MTAPKTLNTKHKVAALLEARGELQKQEIADAVNLSVGRMMVVRSTPEYKLLVEQYSKELTERTLDEAASLLAQFNKEAPKAFGTLQQLHQKSDRDSTRLGAAKEILDRATASPKKVTALGEQSGGVTIQLGAQRMGMILGALDHIGEHDTIELFEKILL